MIAVVETNNLPMFRNLIRNTKHSLRISYCVFLCLLAACTPTGTPTPFIPPSGPKITPSAAISVSFSTPTPQAVELEPSPTTTITPEVSPLPEASPTLELPTPTSAPCTDSLKYLEDLNYPDGSIVSPGQILEKQWRVENNGTCNWDGRYRLKLIDGFPPMGAFGEQSLFPARSGTKATLMVNFAAPLEAGTYRTAWQAYSPEGAPFGETVYMEIVVQSP
jgi:hypothetical protein